MRWRVGLQLAAISFFIIQYYQQLTGQSGRFFKTATAECQLSHSDWVVVHYVSSTAEDIDFCSVGAGLRRLSALHQKDVDGEIRP